MLYKPFLISHNLIWYADILIWCFSQCIQYTAVFGMNLLVLIIFNIPIRVRPCSLGGLHCFSYLTVKAISYLPSQSMISMVQLHTCARTDVFPAGKELPCSALQLSAEIVTSTATHLTLARYPVCFSLLSDCGHEITSSLCPGKGESRSSFQSPKNSSRFIIPLSTLRQFLS